MNCGLLVRTVCTARNTSTSCSSFIRSQMNAVAQNIPLARFPSLSIIIQIIGLYSYIFISHTYRHWTTILLAFDCKFHCSIFSINSIIISCDDGLFAGPVQPRRWNCLIIESLCCKWKVRIVTLLSFSSLINRIVNLLSQ